MRLNHAKEMTKRKEIFLKKKFPDYKLITMQECDFDEMFKEDNYKEMLITINKEISTTFISPRSFYFGGKLFFRLKNIFFNIFLILGRVNAVVLIKECNVNEEIKYFDFTSLYPAVMKKEAYPLGIF